jgi:hypothetical protein
MKPSSPIFPGRTFFRLLFFVMAVDSLLAALVMLYRAEGLLSWLGLPETAKEAPHDREMLLMVLGWLALAHCVVLGMLGKWPEELGPLAAVPLLGRLMGAALWLWVWATPRLHLAPEPVLWLAVHDAIWVPGLVGFLFAWRRWRSVS